MVEVTDSKEPASTPFDQSALPGSIDAPEPFQRQKGPSPLKPVIGSTQGLYEDDGVIHAESRFDRRRESEPELPKERRIELGKMGIELGKSDIFGDKGLLEVCLKLPEAERAFVIEGCADQMAYRACGIDPNEQVTSESPKKLEALSRMRLVLFDNLTGLVAGTQDARLKIQEKA